MSFVGTHDTQFIYVPVPQILEAGDRYQFRLPAPDLVEELRGSFIRSGQTHPIFLEDLGAGGYVLLDGHRRREAVRSVRESGGHWDKMLAHVVPTRSLSVADRFQLLLDKNFMGKHAYGLIERGRFFKAFIAAGLTIRQIADRCGMSAHDVEDQAELAAVDPTLAALLNAAPIDPLFAVMLHRRYDGWRKSAFANLAEATARKLLDHLYRDRLTMKAWRFLLDFYWTADRPFMA